MQELAAFMVDKFYYVFLGCMALYVLIKIRYKNSDKKRRIFFILGLGIFLTYTGAITVIEGILPQWTLPVIILIAIGGMAFFIRKFWLFRMTCASCSNKMDWTTIITDDRNLCTDCLGKLEDEQNGES